MKWNKRILFKEDLPLCWWYHIEWVESAQLAC
jgi:hypothetical protein